MTQEHVIAKKKLIEVALPLDAINKASAREKSIRHGHPSTLHLWWARRPLAAARAVIFAQMVDDPSSNPDLFPTELTQERERQRLFGIIEELVLWENTTNEVVLQKARDEIWQSWRRACAENADHPRARELFDRHVLPEFYDPFAGGGSLPLEAQRLGLNAHASDLNPVAVLINKAMIEIPPKFARKTPVNPKARGEQRLVGQTWHGSQGLADDVRYYGDWMRDEAAKRIGHLYPKAKVTQAMAASRPDLLPYVGRDLTVIAWIWARTVKSPNPAFATVDVPLVSTFMLSTKSGKEAYVEPTIEDAGYRFAVVMGKPTNADAAKNGTKLSRGAHFRCMMSDVPITPEYIRSEAMAGRMGTRLMAIVAEGDRSRVYLSPTAEHEAIAATARPEWKPDAAMPDNPRWFSPPLYGLATFGDLFTPRQLVVLTAFSDLVTEALAQVRHDASVAGLPNDDVPLRSGGLGALAYAEAVAVYLAFGVSRQANRLATAGVWNRIGEKIEQVFARQAIAMTWDFPEANALSASTGGWSGSLEWIPTALGTLPDVGHGEAHQGNAASETIASSGLISTDPPYYDNIGYADLSDFFYVWLRRALQPVFPELLSTLVVPKTDELVATPYRHGGKAQAESFFLGGMTDAMRRISQHANPAFPVTIYYAFRQSETTTAGSTASTGWETFLAAIIKAGLGLTGTWPIHTERDFGVKTGTNSLASSIVLVCRPQLSNAPGATRREFQDALRKELPEALAHLQRSNIAPVDLAQASIGPGMGVFTRFREVLNADGTLMSVREALALINQTLDEVLTEQEGDFDADSRWAVTWSDQFGYQEGEFDVANTLATAKATSVEGIARAGIVESRRGKVRLLKPAELKPDWDPAGDPRLTAWEMTHHLIRALESGGEGAAGALAAKLGGKAEVARELAYRLYVVSERKKRAADALSYNGLVQSWPEITRLAREHVAGDRGTPQGTMALDQQ